MRSAGARDAATRRCCVEVLLPVHHRARRPGSRRRAPRARRGAARASTRRASCGSARCSTTATRCTRCRAGRGVRPRPWPSAPRRHGRAAAQRGRHPARVVGVRAGPRPRGPRRPGAGHARPDAAPAQRLPRRRGSWSGTGRGATTLRCPASVRGRGARGPTPGARHGRLRRAPRGGDPETAYALLGDPLPPHAARLLGHRQPVPARRACSRRPDTRTSCAPSWAGCGRTRAWSSNYGSIDHLGAVDYFLALGEHALGEDDAALAHARAASSCSSSWTTALAAPRRGARSPSSRGDPRRADRARGKSAAKSRASAVARVSVSRDRPRRARVGHREEHVR